MEKNLSNLSAEELQEQLQQLERSKRKLQKALEQQKERRKIDLAARIRDMIVEEGLDVAEVVGLIEKKRRGGSRARKSAGSYTTYVDPQNPKNVYVRGVLPGWMKEKMQSLHLDPSNKEHRDEFKSKHLKAIKAND